MMSYCYPTIKKRLSALVTYLAQLFSPKRRRILLLFSRPAVIKYTFPDKRYKETTHAGAIPCRRRRCLDHVSPAHGERCAKHFPSAAVTLGTAAQQQQTTTTTTASTIHPQLTATQRLPSKKCASSGGICSRIGGGVPKGQGDNCPLADRGHDCEQQ